MSKLVISDLPFLTELDNQESKVAGAASAGGAAAANYRGAGQRCKNKNTTKQK